MGWVILVVAYLLVGLGVFAWGIRGHETSEKKRSAKALALLPELCLFWPVILIVKIKGKKDTASSASSDT